MNVLTATFWPSLNVDTSPCIFPPDMQQIMRNFEQYYHSKHSGRRLTWQPNLGTADVRVQFKNRKLELNVSTYALMVLLLFQNLRADESMGYVDIKNSTGMPDSDLQRTLQSLACAKYKILLKDPKGRDVNTSDRFTFNENFTAPLARIKIAQIVARVETQQERKETNEKVIEERNHLTDVSRFWSLQSMTLKLTAALISLGGHCPRHERSQGGFACRSRQRGDQTDFFSFPAISR